MICLVLARRQQHMAADWKSGRARYARIKGPYTQPSVKKRIEAFLLDNIGRTTAREQIMEVAKDPKTGWGARELASAPFRVAN
jgi:hypothetical protein